MVTAIFHLRDQALARSELGLQPDGKYILYVGRLNAAKGLRELLRGFAVLRRRMPQARLIMIGEGRFRAELEDSIRRDDMRQQTTILGPFSNEQLGPWFGACDVFALPSYNEGCPNVVVEALNSGRPVVASAVGGIPDLISGESGFLVPSRRATRSSRRSKTHCLGISGSQFMRRPVLVNRGSVMISVLVGGRTASSRTCSGCLFQ